MITAEIKTQLQQYLELLEAPVLLSISAEPTSDMAAFVNDIAAMSELIEVKETTLERTPSFKVGDRITFAGIPLGHEFSSFIMALLQVSGRKPKIDDQIIEQIKNIREKFHFETYISLSCHNCPDVVQALNIMAVLNPNITHTMIDGANFQNEIEEKQIMAVPTIEKDGTNFLNGKQSIEEILAKLGNKKDWSGLDGKLFDSVIVGGGPAGASAAIYLARKGLEVAMIAEKVGGQVSDTMGIENLIGTPYTEGPKLVADLQKHISDYSIEVINLEKVCNIQKDENFTISLESGTKINAKTVIISTGARWRNLGIQGEDEFKNKGVAYCPHCDGPLFKNKKVAVIGGGNSGVEAAIDLAGIVGHVSVFEYLPELKADKILQDKLHSLKNVSIHTNTQTKTINGSDKVESITYIDRATNEEKIDEIEGVFVQIGLVPNTDFIDIEKDNFGQIIVDQKNQTSIEGLFAAGDCTNTPYKQIIISMGQGANAALAAFDYLIRQK